MLKRRIRLSELLCMLLIALGVPGINNAYVSYFRVAVTLLWMLFVLLEQKNRVFHKITLAFVFFMLFLFVTSMYSLDFGGAMKNLSAQLLLLSPMLFYAGYRDKAGMKAIMIAALVVWVGICLNAIVFYYANPHAARILARDQNYFGRVWLGGGYSLAYGAALLSSFLTGVLFNVSIRKKIYKTLTVVGIIISVLLVLKTVSLITIIALFSGVIANLILLFVNRQKGKGRIAFVLFFTVILLIVLVLSWNSIADFIISRTANSTDVIDKRLLEIGQTMQGTSTNDSDLSQRIQLIISSIKVFFKHPIIGSGYIFGYDYRSSLEIGIGNHGQLADILALYGIVGGAPLLYCFYAAGRDLKLVMKRGVYIPVIVSFLVMFVFNPFNSFQSNLIFFFIVPGLAKLIKEQKDEPETVQDTKETVS